VENASGFIPTSLPQGYIGSRSVGTIFRPKINRPFDFVDFCSVALRQGNPFATNFVALYCRKKNTWLQKEAILQSEVVLLPKSGPPGDEIM